MNLVMRAQAALDNLPVGRQLQAAFAVVLALAALVGGVALAGLAQVDGQAEHLARNAAYAAVSQGQQYCGPIDVLGTQFDACYNPIKDAGGKIIGVSYIGHKK